MSKKEAITEVEQLNERLKYIEEQTANIQKLFDRMYRGDETVDPQFISDSLRRIRSAAQN